jgi:hypothetical protein
VIGARSSKGGTHLLLKMGNALGSKAKGKLHHPESSSELKLQKVSRVSRQLVEDLWSVCAQDRLFITCEEASSFLLSVCGAAGVAVEHDALRTLCEQNFAHNEVSHEDLHNLLFLAKDELEDVHLTESLDQV